MNAMVFMSIITAAIGVICLLTWCVVNILRVHDEWRENKHSYLIFKKANGKFYLKRRFLFYFWRKYKSYRVYGNTDDRVIEYFLSYNEARDFAKGLPTYFRTEEKDKEAGRV